RSATSSRAWAASSRWRSWTTWPTRCPPRPPPERRSIHRMTGLHVVHVVEGQHAGRVRRLPLAGRLEHEGVVVAGVGPAHDPPGEPVEALEDGRPARPRRPAAAGELVDLVARLGPEQLDELPVADAGHVDHDRGGALDHAPGVVGLRDAHEEA